MISERLLIGIVIFDTFFLFESVCCQVADMPYCGSVADKSVVDREALLSLARGDRISGPGNRLIHGPLYTREHVG